MQDVLKSIVGIRGRDKKADLKATALLWTEDPYVQQGWGDTTGKVLKAVGIPAPPSWETKKWYRLNRYVGDLLDAVPDYFKTLVEADA